MFIFPISANYYKAEIFNDRYYRLSYKEIADKYKLSEDWIMKLLSCNGKWFSEFQEFREIMDRANKPLDI